MKLFIKKLIGIYSIIVYPSYGGCFRCLRQWKIVAPHHTMYSDSAGCFPLCGECWRELTPETRLPFYRKLYNQWASELNPCMPTFQDIKNAVMRGE
jgi:hypothetical protein